MTTIKDTRFDPNPAARAVYDELYGIYRELHDAFGGVSGATGNLGTVMKRLLDVKERSTRHAAAPSARVGA